MAPQVSLSYSSRNGYGLAGVGWSLNAASSISRCSATLAQDGEIGYVDFTAANDKLCLDGQRLIAIDGQYGQKDTQYALELDNYTRVVQKSGNLDATHTYFEVHTSNLRTSYYGNSVDSRQSPSNTSKTQSWLISKVLDSSQNNHMSFYYQDFGVGEVLLERIVYTGDGVTDGNREVVFEYENRRKVRFSYLAGTKSRVTKQLDYIDTFYKGSRVRRYTLDYKESETSKRDLLFRIRECAYITGTQCKEYTNFEYSEDSPATSFQPLSVTGNLEYPNVVDIHDILPRGDLNGDGVRDWPGKFVNAEGELTGTTSQTLSPCYRNYLMSSPICVSLDFNLDGLTDDWEDRNDILFLKNSATGAWTSTGIVLDKRGSNTAFKDGHLAHVADYNVDGWPDLVVYKYNNQRPEVSLHLHTQNVSQPYNSTGQLLFTIPTIYKGSTTSLQPTHDVQFMGDMNGDNTPDLVVTKTVAARYEAPYAQPRPEQVWYYQANSNSFDKRTFTYNTGNFGQSADYSFFYDINSDGLVDWLGLQPVTGGGGQLVARINLGNKTFSAQKVVGGDSFRKKTTTLDISNNPNEPTHVDVVTFFYANAFKVSDIDSDGYTEILEPSTRLVEGCSLVYTGPYGQQEQRCGDELYGSYVNSDYRVVPLEPEKRDESIYEWAAYHFEFDSNENITLERRPTGFIGHAYQSAIVDVYGTGLPSMVSLHKTHGDASFVGSGAGSEFAGYLGDYGAYVSLNKGAASANENYKPHDLLEEVSNPNGISASWVYRPLTTGEFGRAFRAGESHLYPELSERPFYYPDFGYTGQLQNDNNEYFHFTSSMYAVAEFNIDNGVGGTNAHHYQYSAAVFNTQGRGFMGFREIEHENIATGIVVDTEFHQVFPYTGFVEKVEKRLTQDSQVFDSTQHTWEINTAHSTAVTGTTMLYNASTVKNVNDAYFPSINLYSESQSVAQSDIDRYGNILKSTIIRTDEFGSYSTITTKDFRYSTELWPHKLFSETVQKDYQRASQVPNIPNVGISKAITTYFESYDAVSKKPSTVTTNAGTNIVSSSSCLSSYKNQCTVRSIGYNDYGLPIDITVQGHSRNTSNPISRTTIINYSDSGNSVYNKGYFPYQQTQFVNNITHQSKSRVDPRTGNEIEKTDVSGVKTSTTYDGFSRPASIKVSGLPYQYIRYLHPDSDAPNYAEMMVSTFQAGLPNSRVYVDEYQRTLRSAEQGFNGSPIFTDVRYDELGNITHESQPYDSTPVFTRYEGHDAFGRPSEKINIATENGEDFTTTYIYQGLETAIQTTAPDGYNLSMARYSNSYGILMRTVDSIGGETKYTYDAANNPIGITDAVGNVIEAEYDDFSRKKWVHDPNQGLTRYTYNGFGELEREYDANGEYIDYVHDSLGRVTQRLSTDGNATFEWDTQVVGLLSSETSSGITKSYTYDTYGRPKTVTSQIANRNYTQITYYDGNYGRVKGWRYPNGLTVELTYNQYGYLKAESNAASGYVYRDITAQDVLGNITNDSIANGNQLGSYGYSLRTGQMLYSRVMKGASTLHYQDYVDYDSYGNIIEQQNLAVNINGIDSFEYDELHRLTRNTIEVAGDPVRVINYGYDAIGNFLKKTDYSTNTSSSYQYVNGTHKLSSVNLLTGGSELFGYDNKGNLTHRRHSSESSLREETKYNVFNKPTWISRLGATLQFDYDSSNERFKQTRTSANGTTTTTYYLGKSFEVEVSGASRTESTYISDIAILKEKDLAQTIRFTHRDRLGSATTFTDQFGQVLALRSYDPFGKPRVGDGSLLSTYGLRAKLANNVLDTDQPTMRGFTDHEHLDEVEIIHMNGRVYDYNLGRFLSVDPFIQAPGNSQSINPYSYLMNNPLAGTDPTGYIGCAEGDTCTESTTTKTHYETKTGSRIKTKSGSTTTTTTTNQNGDTVNVTSTTVMNNGNFQTSSVSYDNGAVTKVSASKGNFNTGDAVGVSTDIGSQGGIAKSSNDSGSNINITPNWCHRGSCRTGIASNIDVRSLDEIDAGLERLNSIISTLIGGPSLANGFRSLFTKGATKTFRNASDDIDEVYNSIFATMVQRGNFNIGSFSRKQMNEIGMQWVGANPQEIIKQGKLFGFRNSAGTRIFRLPRLKRNGVAAGRTQGNLVEVERDSKGNFVRELRNAHMDLIE